MMNYGQGRRGPAAEGPGSSHAHLKELMDPMRAWNTGISPSVQIELKVEALEKKVDKLIDLVQQLHVQPAKGAEDGQ